MNDSRCFELTDPQIASFWDEGFLSVANITPPSEIDTLRADYDAITNLVYSPTQIAEMSEKQGLPLDGGRSLFLWIPLPGILSSHSQEDSSTLDEAIQIAKHCLKLHAKFVDREAYEERAIALITNLLKMQENIKQTIYLQNVIEIAAQILRVKTAQILAEGRIFWKPARYGSVIDWHQDAAHAECSDLIKIWMTLDPVDEQNGCMEFIKYSHQSLLKYQRDRSDPTGSFMRTDESEIDLSHRVSCPLPAGGGTIHHRLTLHRTGLNRSHIPRRVLTAVCRLVDRDATHQFC